MLFNYGTVEVLHMRWLKKDIWKAGITYAGILLFLVLMVWVPVSAAGAYEEASGLCCLSNNFSFFRQINFPLVCQR